MIQCLHRISLIDLLHLIRRRGISLGKNMPNLLVGLGGGGGGGVRGGRGPTRSPHRDLAVVRHGNQKDLR